MPMHDWTKAEPGTFHSFHLLWIASLANTLNKGLLPPGYYALGEKFMGMGEPDVLTLSQSEAETIEEREEEAAAGGLALLTEPPKTKFLEVADEDARDAWRSSRIVVRYKNKSVIAAIEIVSPGNKSNSRAFAKFMEKSTALIESGIHLLIIDPFPPGKYDAKGLHQAIWKRLGMSTKHKPMKKKNRILAAYEALDIPKGYVEPFGVGDKLMDMPLYLLPDRYINVPLEKTYQWAWENFPVEVQREVT